MSAPTLGTLALDQVVSPGDRVAALPTGGELRVGPGLAADGDWLATARAGVLRRAKGGKLWVEGRAKRYLPSPGDPVVGTVTERHGEGYAVDVGGPFPAALPALAFEGATRRNRPALSPGDAVYARVAEAGRDVDPVLACTDADGRAGGYGPLAGGLMLATTITHARSLLSSPRPPILDALAGAGLAFELAVGANGRVWVGGGRVDAVAAVARALAASEFADEAEAARLAAAAVSSLID